LLIKIEWIGLIFVFLKPNGPNGSFIVTLPN